jgi:hypothetical protein
MKLTNAAIKIAVLAMGLAQVAEAEIILLEGGGIASADPAYAFQHPSLRSVVFVSPETRQMAILPPSPVFIEPAPLIWRSSTAMPVYPPIGIPGGLNTPAKPSNRDMSNYHLQRAHAFGQGLFYRDTYLSLGGGPVLYGYGYSLGSLGTPYPPPMAPSFNQPARPSNQNMSIYNLERAHRFSMDAYKER